MKRIVLCMSVMFLFVLLACNSGKKGENSKMDSDIGDILQKSLVELQADSGYVLVIDTAGQVKVSVNMVLGADGKYEKGSNRIFSAQSEMGSLLMPFALIPALEDGLITWNDSIEIPGDTLMHDGVSITDENTRMARTGKITVKDIVATSSNIGMAKILLENYEEQPMMFTQKLKLIRIVNVPSPDDTKTFLGVGQGYGVTMTPAEMLSFYYTVSKNDTTLCSDTTMMGIREILDETVASGLGMSALSEKVKIAGKTGSAITEDEVKSEFCGYFPADAPQYTCLVVISNPKNSQPIEKIAGDTFRQIAEYIIEK